MTSRIRSLLPALLYFMGTAGLYILLSLLLEGRVTLALMDFLADFAGLESGAMAQELSDSMLDMAAQDFDSIWDWCAREFGIIWNFLLILLPGLPTSFLIVSLDRMILRFVPQDTGFARVLSFLAAFLLQQIVLLAWQDPVDLPFLWTYFLKDALLIYAAGIFLHILTSQALRDWRRHRAAGLSPRDAILRTLGLQKPDTQAGEERLSPWDWIQKEWREIPPPDDAANLNIALGHALLYELSYSYLAVVALILAVWLLAALLFRGSPEAMGVAFTAAPLLYILTMRLPHSPVDRAISWLLHFSQDDRDFANMEKWSWTTGLFCLVVLVACFVLRFLYR